MMNLWYRTFTTFYYLFTQQQIEINTENLSNIKKTQIKYEKNNDKK